MNSDRFIQGILHTVCLIITVLNTSSSAAIYLHLYLSLYQYFKMQLSGLRPCHSKYGPQASDTSAPSSVRNAEPQAPPRPPDSESAFQQDPQMTHRHSKVSETRVSDKVFHSSVPEHSKHLCLFRVESVLGNQTRCCTKTGLMEPWR